MPSLPPPFPSLWAIFGVMVAAAMPAPAGGTLTTLATRLAFSTSFHSFRATFSLTAAFAPLALLWRRAIGSDMPKATTVVAFALAAAFERSKLLDELLLRLLSWSIFSLRHSLFQRTDLHCVGIPHIVVDEPVDRRS